MDSMNIRPFRGIVPTLGARAYVDPAACVIGDVHLGEDSSVWPGCVVRGDVNHIRIGARTNIQDGTIVHVTHDGPYTQPDGWPCLIGDDVTIGHGAIIHACTIGDACLIGMGATVLDGAVIQKNGFVGAGAVVPPGKVLASGHVYMGSPAKAVRPLTDSERSYFTYTAANYVKLKDSYRAEAAD